MTSDRRISRTARAEGAPYTWENFVARDGERVVENELDACLQSGCRTQTEYDMRWAEVEARMRRAAAGNLHAADADEATPVRKQPYLWEIRWNFSARPFRLYHAEPSKQPRLLLALKYHWKDTSFPTRDQVLDEQDRQMAEAARRYQSSPLHPGEGLDD